LVWARLAGLATAGCLVHQGLRAAADPHAWHDLVLARRYVANLSAAFVRHWPARKAEVEQRKAHYRPASTISTSRCASGWTRCRARGAA
jgi:hypothetical protein